MLGIMCDTRMNWECAFPITLNDWCHSSKLWTKVSKTLKNLLLYSSTIMNSEYQSMNCKFYGSMRGCRYGNNCVYSHSNPNSVPLCYHWNNCRYGNDCKFRHINFRINLNTNTNIMMNNDKSVCKPENDLSLYRCVYVFLLSVFVSVSLNATHKAFR